MLSLQGVHHMHLGTIDSSSRQNIYIQGTLKQIIKAVLSEKILFGLKKTAFMLRLERRHTVYGRSSQLIA